MIKLLIGILMCGSFAHAETVDCEELGKARCNWPAVGVYKCGNKTGHLLNNTPLKNIKVAFLDKTTKLVSLTLDAPDGEFISRYGSHDNEKGWVIAALKKKGYSIADLKEFTTQSIGVDESTKIYKDHHARAVEHASLKNPGDGELRGEHFKEFGIYCYYSEYPIRGDKGGRAMCTAQAKCDPGDGKKMLLPFHIFCRADANDLCPKYASECAADQDSQPGFPKYSEVSDPYGVLIGPSDNRKANPSANKTVQ